MPQSSWARVRSLLEQNKKQKKLAAATHSIFPPAFPTSCWEGQHGKTRSILVYWILYYKRKHLIHTVRNMNRIFWKESIPVLWCWMFWNIFFCTYRIYCSLQYTFKERGEPAPVAYTECSINKRKCIVHAACSLLVHIWINKQTCTCTCSLLHWMPLEAIFLFEVAYQENQMSRKIEPGCIRLTQALLHLPLHVGEGVLDANGQEAHQAFRQRFHPEARLVHLWKWMNARHCLLWSWTSKARIHFDTRVWSVRYGTTLKSIR